MTSGLQFWDISIWSLLLAFAMIFVSGLVANTLIQSIKPLKKALIPAPVLGGILLLIVLSIIKGITKEDILMLTPVSNIENQKVSMTTVLEIITYHALGIGFVAGSLKNKKKSSKASNKDILNSSFFTIGGYSLQAIVGLICTIILSLFIKNVWPASGVLLPMGYGQGPGQAFNWGTTFMNYANTAGIIGPDGIEKTVSVFGPFTNGDSFGLSVAAMGFICASIGGVIYLNIQRRKGNIKMVKESDKVERLKIEDYETEGEIASSDSIDKSTIQVGLVIIIYGISFLLLYGISKLCDISNVKLLINTVKPLFWGFNFIFGVLVATIYKLIYSKLRKKNVIKKEYINNYMMDRISGLAFDVMVIAAFGSIDLTAFLIPSFIIPLSTICIIGGIVTYFYCQHISKKVFKDYSDEEFVAFYGMLTGTNATGIILLREVDPQFDTPACDNLVFQSLYSIAFGAPILLSLGSVGKSWTSLFVCIGIYVALFVVLYLLMRREDIFKKKNKDQ